MSDFIVSSSYNRNGDKLEIIIRNSNFEKIFQKEINAHNRKEQEILLKDLRDKGIDLIGVIVRKYQQKQSLISINDSDWFF